MALVRSSAAAGINAANRRAVNRNVILAEYNEHGTAALITSVALDMQSQPLGPFRNEVDAEGNISLVWEGIGRLESRLIALLLLLAATLWPWLSHSVTLDFWRLLHEKNPGGPDWMGLFLTGAESAFIVAFAIVALLVAYRLVFDHKPERLTRKPGKWVYDAGSTGLMQGGRGTGGLSLWRALVGRTEVEIPMEEFNGASVDSYRRITFVTLNAGKRSVRVGRWLRPNEQQQLVRILTDWQQNRVSSSSRFGRP